MSTELAWCAGFFDGEGSVHVTRDRRPGRRWGLQLNIEQVDRRPLERFVAAVGGRIGQRRARPGRSPIYRVCMGHATTVAAVELMWPYLSAPKREQFLRAKGEVDGQTAVA